MKDSQNSAMGDAMECRTAVAYTDLFVHLFSCSIPAVVGH